MRSGIKLALHFTPTVARCRRTEQALISQKKVRRGHRLFEDVPTSKYSRWIWQLRIQGTKCVQSDPQFCRAQQANPHRTGARAIGNSGLVQQKRYAKRRWKFPKAVISDPTDYNLPSISQWENSVRSWEFRSAAPVIDTTVRGSRNSRHCTSWVGHSGLWNESDAEKRLRRRSRWTQRLTTSV